MLRGNPAGRGIPEHRKLSFPWVSRVLKRNTHTPPSGECCSFRSPVLRSCVRSESEKQGAPASTPSHARHSSRVLGGGTLSDGEACIYIISYFSQRNQKAGNILFPIPPGASLRLFYLWKRQGQAFIQTCGSWEGCRGESREEGEVRGRP